jgi:hypothetical protein
VKEAVKKVIKECIKNEYIIKVYYNTTVAKSQQQQMPPQGIRQNNYNGTKPNRRNEGYQNSNMPIQENNNYGRLCLE